MVLTCEKPVLRAKASQRQNYKVSLKQPLPTQLEKLLVKLIFMEMMLAANSEMLKQNLVSQYDFKPDIIYKLIDDFGLSFIDQRALRRFLKKCFGTISSTKMLIAVIRRMDLDSDSRLCKQEFFEAVIPIENFTKGSLDQLKLQLDYYED